MALTNESLADLRKLLEDRRERLRKELERAKTGTNGARALAEIEAALKRLDEGKYGFCESCFLEIPQRELLARPERRHCSQCRR